MYKYNNVSDDNQTIIAPGNVRPRTVAPGGEVLSDVPIENPNFSYVGEVEDRQTDAGIVGVQTPQANAVTEAELIDNEKDAQ